jgi:hypothetical protein
MCGIGLRYRNQPAKAEPLTGPVGNRVGIGLGPGSQQERGGVLQSGQEGKRTCKRQRLEEPIPHMRGLLIALMMEAASTSEMLVNFYQTTKRYNPEDSHLLRKVCNITKI